MVEDTRSLYVTALQNTYGIELQALQIMERQVERLKNYPEMEHALRRHIEETHGQRELPNSHPAAIRVTSRLGSGLNHSQ